MTLSNENIVYIYLKTKFEIVQLDQRIRDVEIYCQEKSKVVTKGLQDEKLLQQLEFMARLTGTEVNMDELKKQIKDQNEEQMELFRVEMITNLKEALQYRANILKDLKVAFNVLKEEMPDLIEKFNKHLKIMPPDESLMK